MSSLPTVGIIGGGQLARMMYTAAIPLGLPVRLLAESPTGSAGRVIADTGVGDYTDADTVEAFAAECDVITFDHEHVPPPILRNIDAAGHTAVRPHPDALIHAQDKAIMRERLTQMGVPCPAWRVAADPDAVRAFGDERGWPVIAKVSRGGYDGHGVWRVDSADDAPEPFRDLPDGAVIVAEEFVDFARELSVVIVRSPSDQAVSYPVSETIQTDGICVETVTPAPGLDAAQASDIQQLGLRIARGLGVVGVLAVELMQRRDGSVVVNELAMRPHNTGHWSIDGATTSQFANHLRAVADLGLGSPAARAPWTVMVNVLGGETDAWPSALAHVLPHDPAIQVHWYGKKWRAGRKLGHVTAWGDSLDDARARARHAAAALRGEGDDA